MVFEVLKLVRENKAKTLVKKYLDQVAPGFLHALNSYCLRKRGVDCVSLLLEDPEELRALLIEKNPLPVVEFVGKLLVKPLLAQVKKEELSDLLARVFVEDPPKFKKMLGEVLGDP